MKNSLPASHFYIHRACFSELSLSQFYQLAKLRQDVFILEQQSFYPDLDGLDDQASHFLCYASSSPDLIGYARYRQSELQHRVQIERVVLAPSTRGKGLGQQLTQTILTDIKQRYPGFSVSLSAQTQVQAFYHALGFVAKGDPYDDAGIEHITMVYQA